MPFCNVTDLFVDSRDVVRQVMDRINVTLRGIALVVDKDRRLLGTIVDGDVRRAILAGMTLETPARELLDEKGGSAPLTAPIGTDRSALLRMMREHSVRQVPLVDGDGHVVDLVTLTDLVPEPLLPMQAVIMAGGFGARLHPLTEDVPKPMLPVGGRPLMELMIERLRQAGVRRVNVTTHYKAGKIIEHFGDGGNFGVEVNYVAEDRPLGTAGALGLMRPPQETVLVINGDILTQVDVRAMHAYHREHKAVLTVGVRKYDMSVPYGVIEPEGAFVRSLVEKPVLSFFVNAGVYLLEPPAHRYIPGGERFEMTDLIRCLLEAKQPVVSFPILEYWLDIGRPTDYVQAQEDIKRFNE